MTMTNAKIFEEGTIVGAKKLSVLTIGIGKVGSLKNAEKVIWRDENGNVVIATKEKPEGCVYDKERTAVVRVIGGKVLMDGLYDIYAPDDSKIEKLLSNPVYIDDILTEEQIQELMPVFIAASEIRPSMAPEEAGRRVIVITDEMISNGVTVCYNEWEPETACNLSAGDVFVVSDESQMKGYRIGKEEFEGTHAFE